MSEIRSKNLKNDNGNNRQQENNANLASPTTTDTLDKNDLQPLQVNIIDSDVDKLKDK